MNIRPYLLALLAVIFFLNQSQCQSPIESPYSKTEKVGDIFLIALPVLSLGSTLIICDKKGTWQFTKGLVFTEAITYGLKWAIKKQRPDLSDENSFPSGHTSTTFFSAIFLHKRYGFKYSIVPYALAGFTAASRIDSQKHDVLDVLGGVTIGLISNLLFTTEYQKRHINLTFSKKSNAYQIGAILTF